MAASFHREEIERRETDIMIHQHVAGIVVIPSGLRNEHFVEAQRNGIPVVSLDRPLEGAEADSIVVDNRAASQKVTEHLIDHGHRQILCLVDDERVFTKSERVAGYSQAMRRDWSFNPRHVRWANEWNFDRSTQLFIKFEPDSNGYFCNQ